MDADPPPHFLCIWERKMRCCLIQKQWSSTLYSVYCFTNFISVRIMQCSEMGLSQPRSNTHNVWLALKRIYGHKITLCRQMHRSSRQLSQHLVCKDEWRQMQSAERTQTPCLKLELVPFLSRLCILCHGNSSTAISLNQIGCNILTKANVLILKGTRTYDWLTQLLKKERDGGGGWWG